MYLEAKETARLYKLLSDQLGSDTTEAMFKYIDNKTERSVEATIKTLATKDDIATLRLATKDDMATLRDEISMARLASKDDIAVLRKELGEYRSDTMKWMFIFWVGNVGTMLAITLLILKK